MAYTVRPALIIGALVAAFVLLFYHLGWLEPGDILWRRMMNLPSSLADSQLYHVLTWGLVIPLSLGIAWTSIDIPRRTLRFVIGLAALSETIFLAYVLALYSLGFSLLAAVLAPFLAYLGGLIYSSTRPVQRRQRLLNLLQDRVSKNRFREIVKSTQDASIPFEGAHQLGVVALEIFDTGQTGAKASAARLGRILGRAKDFIVETEGMTDQSGANSVIGLFGLMGSGEENSRPVLRACRVALGLRDRLEALISNLEHETGRRPVYGIAVEFGEVNIALEAGVAGQTLDRLLIFGRAIDEARRLCRATLRFGNRITTKGPIYEQVEWDILARPIELIQAKPEEPPQELYELINLKEASNELETQRVNDYWSGVIYLRENSYSQAHEAFLKAQPLIEEDGPHEIAVDPVLDYQFERLKASQEKAKTDGSPPRHQPLELL